MITSIPSSRRSTGKPSPIPPARSPRSRSGRGSSPVSADAATGIVAQQREDEYIHRMNLPFSAGVGRTSVAVEAALIANTDTIQVVSLGVRTYPFNLPRRLDAPFLRM